MARFAAATEAAKAEQSRARELARQGGLFLRATLNGSVGTLNRAFDSTVGNVVNTAVNLINSTAGTSIPNLASTANQLAREMDRALPQPQNSTERVVQRVVESVTSAAIFGHTAGSLSAQASSPVIQATAAQLSANHGLSLAGAATSATGSALVAENGGGTVAQLAAGAAGALVPGAIVAARTAATSAIVPPKVAQRVATATTAQPTLLEQMTPRLAAAGKRVQEHRVALDGARRDLANYRAAPNPDAKTVAMLEDVVSRFRQTADEAVAAFRTELVEASPGFRGVASLPEFATTAKGYFDDALRELDKIPRTTLEKIATPAKPAPAPIAAAPAPPPGLAATPELKALAARARLGSSAADVQAFRSAVLQHAKSSGHPEVTQLSATITKAAAYLDKNASRLTERALVQAQDHLASDKRALEALVTTLADAIRP